MKAYVNRKTPLYQECAQKIFEGKVTALTHELSITKKKVFESFIRHIKEVQGLQVAYTRSFGQTYGGTYVGYEKI